MMWCDAISHSFLRQPVVWKMACAKTGSDNQQKKHRIRGAFFVKASKRKKCTCTSLETKFLSSWNEHIGWVMMSHYGLKYWMFTFSYQSINPEIHGSLIIESSNFERVFSLFFRHDERGTGVVNGVQQIWKHCALGVWAVWKLSKKNQTVFSQSQAAMKFGSCNWKGGRISKPRLTAVFRPFVVFLFFCLWKLQKDRLRWVNEVRWHVVICFFLVRLTRVRVVSAVGGFLQGQNPFEQNWQMQRKPCGLANGWMFKFSER